MQRAVLSASGSIPLVGMSDICTVAKQSEVAWFFGSHYTGTCLSVEQGEQFCGAADFCTLTTISPVCHGVESVGNLLSVVIRQPADLQKKA